MWKFQHLIGVALLALLLIILPGCSKVTLENYNKIETNMTTSEVEDILGKGEEKVGAAGTIGDLTGSGKVLTWGSEEKSITITFANDKVVAKTQKGL
jgi:hypothetical protein